MELLTTTHKDKISGVISCYDRIVISGTLPGICYQEGMTSYLYQQGIKIFDYTQFVEPLKEQIRKNAEQLAQGHQISIEFVSKAQSRKEDLVSKVLQKRGYGLGLVHILSAMESCPSYQPWHNKQTGKTYLKGDQGKCLHYYFYFIDEYLGLGYMRVPTWCPFRLQVYFNGHSILKNKLDEAGIGYTMLDNAFDSMTDWAQAQDLADDIDVEKIHQILDKYAAIYCPVHQQFGQVYHWSILQAEYATDLVFKQQQSLEKLYDNLIATAIHTVKPDNIATFLGQKLDPRYQGEIGNNYNVRIQGSRIKHSMGNNSIKMYDKFSKILRIETTTNDVSFFKHYRKVEHQDGLSSEKLAGLKKNIYSLRPLKDLLKAANRRYLEFISGIDNNTIGRQRLEKVSKSKSVKQRNYKGFNFFSDQDLKLLLNLLRGEFNIAGFQNKHLKQLLGNLNSNQVSRLLKRLLVHGIVKKVKNTYKYYVTKLGKHVLLTALKLKEMVLIPALNY
jgi:hypothetical protein